MNPDLGQLLQYLAAALPEDRHIGKVFVTGQDASRRALVPAFRPFRGPRRSCARLLASVMVYKVWPRMQFSSTTNGVVGSPSALQRSHSLINCSNLRALATPARRSSVIREANGGEFAYKILQQVTVNSFFHGLKPYAAWPHSSSRPITSGNRRGEMRPAERARSFTRPPTMFWAAGQR